MRPIRRIRATEGNNMPVTLLPSLVWTCLIRWGITTLPHYGGFMRRFDGYARFACLANRRLISRERL